MKHFVMFTLMLACLLVGGESVLAEDGGAHHDGAVVAEHDAHAEVHGQPQWWFLGLITLQTVFMAWLASKHLYVKDDSTYKPAFTALQIFSAFLLYGTVVAQLWAHGDFAGYHATMHIELFVVGEYHITPHFIVNDVFMALFFAVAAKELTEALLKKGGALRGKEGVLPLVACVGGIVGPAVIYRLLCTPDQAGAWAVPCATDIAFAWLGARAVWGPKHPAVLFLLALAIGDDFVGMGIIAVCYPQHSVNPEGFALIAAGMFIAWCFNRFARSIPMFRHWLPYVAVGGALCWCGLLLAGLHSALALVFIVPFMPMSGRDEGVFASGESEHVHDTINAFEHRMKPIVDIGLMYFGLANAGVIWLGEAAWSQNSWAVFLGLGIGKTVGISLFTLAGYAVLRMFGDCSLPTDKESGVTMSWTDVPVVGILGAMGFTVALFVAEAAGGASELKLGALASFGFLGIGVLVGKVLCRKKVEATSPVTA